MRVAQVFSPVLRQSCRNPCNSSRQSIQVVTPAGMSARPRGHSVAASSLASTHAAGIGARSDVRTSRVQRGQRARDAPRHQPAPSSSSASASALASASSSSASMSPRSGARSSVEAVQRRQFVVAEQVIRRVECRPFVVGWFAEWVASFKGHRNTWHWGTGHGKQHGWL